MKYRFASQIAGTACSVKAVVAHALGCEAVTVVKGIGVLEVWDEVGEESWGSLVRGSKGIASITVLMAAEIDSAPWDLIDCKSFFAF